ncbi:MarR family winged helix-turn-helix transcriptional regulator [Pseudomonas sp. NPDC078700]|uniref:MarR family winged helix-turn-helix transcriptional regulator n=1 Tax=Pseudomonas sp. NPDC078700 TaxID=3364424 RepID=UPI0037CA8D2A
MNTPLDPCNALLLDNQMCFALHSTSLMMTKTYKPLLQELGLTYPQYLAMLVLWETDGITVGEISARLLTDPGSVTPLLKRLEAEGLLQRIRTKADERVVELHLTAKGRALHEQAKTIPGCILKATGLPMEQLEEIKQALVTLRKHLRESLDND